MAEGAESKLRMMEEEVEALKREVEAIINGNFEGCETVSNLLVENMKLKHRLAILNKASFLVNCIITES